MVKIPSTTFQDYVAGVDIDIPATELAALKARLSILEAVNTTLSSSVAALNVRIDLMEDSVYRREFVFKASTDIVTINGGQWRIGGLYRVFESLELLSIRGYSMNWPLNSGWQIIALRTNGAQEVQNIPQFMFEVIPPFTTLSFEAGDVLGVLVRNFSNVENAVVGEDNIAMTSMIFRRRRI